jgi:hypothetical protein
MYLFNHSTSIYTSKDHVVHNKSIQCYLSTPKRMNGKNEWGIDRWKVVGKENSLDSENGSGLVHLRN